MTHRSTCQVSVKSNVAPSFRAPQQSEDAQSSHLRTDDDVTKVVLK